MNRCLLETTNSGNSPAIMQELLQWSSEVNSLIVFLAVGNLKNFVAFTSSRLDGNVGPDVGQLPDSWYQSFNVGLVLAASLYLASTAVTCKLLQCTSADKHASLVC